MMNIRNLRLLLIIVIVFGLYFFSHSALANVVEDIIMEEAAREGIHILWVVASGVVFSIIGVFIDKEKLKFWNKQEKKETDLGQIAIDLLAAHEAAC